jgi:hypothetical protein
MDLDELIITWFCWIDDGLQAILQGQRLRQRGPDALLHDSEVLTLEIVGEYLGLEQDAAIFAYFRRHWAHFFPALRTLHRTTVVHQAANLHVVKDRLWQWVREQVPHDAHLALVDSLALPICQFTRAPRCRLFKGEAAYGHDHLTHQPFYGFRVQARVCWPGRDGHG